MKNSEIVVKSLQEWAIQIVNQAMRDGGGSTVFGIVGSFISPVYLANTLIEYVATPYLNKIIGGVPDDVLPGLSSKIVDGMIDERVKKGALPIPMLGVQLMPDAFRSLKGILEGNFAQYGEQKKEAE